ncbi:MAG: caspase family protein, partial [Lentisphaeria bacterium]|nr:caspase family protein [Lentisphaeria bacterium]
QYYSRRIQLKDGAGVTLTANGGFRASSPRLRKDGPVMSRIQMKRRSRMTTRKALIIINPGEEGARNYCEGVFEDLKNLKTYLASPQGGAWQSGEIIERTRPCSSLVRGDIQKLASADYSLVVFSGHGYVQSETGHTILELKSGEILDEMELRAQSTRRTIILDCCKEVYDKQGRKIKMESFQFSVMHKAAESLAMNPVQCRKAFDLAVSKCGHGVIVQHSCKPGQKSGDNEVKGGFYISSLLESAEEWVQNNFSSVKDNQYRPFSTVSAHLAAKPKTAEKAGDRPQTPYIEKPKSEPYFPFAVVTQ